MHPNEDEDRPFSAADASAGTTAGAAVLEVAGDSTSSAVTAAGADDDDCSSKKRPIVSSSTAGNQDDAVRQQQSPAKRPKVEGGRQEREQQRQRTPADSNKDDDGAIPNPIVPTLVPDRSSSGGGKLSAAGAGDWVVRDGGCVLIRVPNGYSSSSARKAASFFAARQTPPPPPTKKKKAAAFDLDGTLLLWRVAGWPTRPDQYELWSSTVVRRLRDAIDTEKYDLLVVVSNQGAIRSAVTGKTADKVKGLINWIAAQVDRPLAAVVSTKSNSGYHKPSAKMWTALEKELHAKFDAGSCFFVGDSDGSDSADADEYQKRGVDRQFAENVGMTFYSPGEYFGDSDMSRRKLADRSAWTPYDAPPASALEIRRCLLGRYYFLSSNTWPILIVLCGVQGSGKSTFCSTIVGGNVDSERRWVSYAQDTIGKNGKPGKREAVEIAVRNALVSGKSVVVDRTHIEAVQRSYFVELGRELKVPVHAVVLNPPESVILKRVRSRTDHPGNVEGEKGARLASMFLKRMSLPQYNEGFDLISVASSDAAADALCEQYRGRHRCASVATCGSTTDDNTHAPLLPTMILGTMAVSKSSTREVVASSVRHGFRAIDTAPTYNNEYEIGAAICNSSGDARPFLAVKVPKRATHPAQVRDEVLASFEKLGTKSVGLIMLHWPCDFVEAGTLVSSWKELEKIQSEGMCKYLGVSNFSVDALRSLLPQCRIKPVVNQVERHPLLPQWELLDFCTNVGIALQAHTPLGHGSAVLLENEVVQRIVAERGRSATPAQVLLLWNLQQGVANVVKCSSAEHQREAIRCRLPFSGRTIETDRGDDGTVSPPDPPLLAPSEMKLLDSIGIDASKRHRFVAPPFMYKPGAPYSWANERAL